MLARRGEGLEAAKHRAAAIGLLDDIKVVTEDGLAHDSARRDPHTLALAST